MMPRRNPLCCPQQLLILLLVVAVVLSSSSLAQAAKTKTWTVYHRLLVPGAAGSDNNHQEWSTRGTIELSADDDASDEQDAAMMAVTNAPDSLSAALAESLTNSSPDSYYQLKLVETSANNNKNDKSNEILTSVPACNVRRANFRDEFVVHLQPGTAQALSVTYLPLISPLAPATCDQYSTASRSTATTTPNSFDSKIEWETAVPGRTVGQPAAIDPVTGKPVGGAIKAPPGLKWIPGAQRKTSNKDDPLHANSNNNEPEQEAGVAGFLKRYWYILLPMMIFNLMGAAAPAQEEAGAAAATAAVGAAGATAAVAGATAGSSPATKQRRGKRD